MVNKKVEDVDSKLANMNEHMEEKMNFFLTMKDPLIQEMLLKRGHKVFHEYGDNIDVALFTGGEDVTPFLYGEKTFKYTQNNWVRDLMEVSLVRSLPANLPKVGICRGAQFLNVHSGGKLWQHVTNHGRTHKVTDHWFGKDVLVTSTHHQMMIPSDAGQVICTANEAGSKEGPDHQWRRSSKEEDAEDVEVVYYDHTKSLCCQYHPEYDVQECTDHFFEYVDMLFSEEAHKRFLAEQETVGVHCG